MAGAPRSGSSRSKFPLLSVKLPVRAEVHVAQEEFADKTAWLGNSGEGQEPRRALKDTCNLTPRGNSGVDVTC